MMRRPVHPARILVKPAQAAGIVRSTERREPPAVTRKGSQRSEECHGYSLILNDYIVSDRPVAEYCNRAGRAPSGAAGRRACGSPSAMEPHIAVNRHTVATRRPSIELTEPTRTTGP
jgi:hypothetical protein